MIQTPTPGQATGEELLGTLGALGGSYLAARGSPLGAPLSLGGAGLASLGYSGSENRTEKARQKQIAEIIQGALPSQSGAAGPDEPKGKVLGSLLDAGEDPKEALGLTTDLYPASKTAVTPYSDWRKANPTAPVSDWYKISREPKAAAKQTPFGLWQQQNPQGTYADYEKAAHANDKGTNVTVEQPLAPGDIMRDPDGKPIGVMMRDKAGNLRIAPTPAGTPDVAPKSGFSTLKTKAAGGYDYELTHPNKDPLNGIARPPAGNTLGAKVFGTPGIPQFLWRINGRYVDPTKLSPDDLKKNAKILINKGFTWDEIMPGTGS